ncbi:PREDICTED: uncharacterized protein LOC107190502 [Dufourea novaeangliae]|uniref:uncharacterized protein LOC107190502 n=1 Tax=Dufourea novaeangliae TaxID=178035 RepID=UPI000767DADC|nr:PREDICTED: uncharacterized protein LOC107190502 [Dufourea novaeangliae]
MLLNLMGPIGQEIYNTFIFQSVNDRENVDVLLKKFDEYYMFAGKKKLPHGENVIKEKILVEINETKFTNIAKTLIPSFVFSSNYNGLLLMEIAFIWKCYDDNDLLRDCTKCGYEHIENNCPALGKHCSKCNNWNHFGRRCPLIFVENCNYCGGAHFKRKCPAFNETCTKCNKKNHFSWKCQSVVIEFCRSCGMTHTASKAVCPANNTMCLFCNTMGHFSSRCYKKPHHQRY